MSGQAAHNFGFTASLIAAIGLSVSVDARSDMDDDPLLTTLMIDQLEARDVDGDNGVFWDVQGWLGQDLNKIWFKTDGDRTAGKSDEAEMQLLYSKAIARYWDIQVGVRHDFEPSASRNWLAIGFKGVAPYFFVMPGKKSILSCSYSRWMRPACSWLTAFFSAGPASLMMKPWGPG